MMKPTAKKKNRNEHKPAAGKTCFVLMPYGDEFAKVYKCIQGACRGEKMRCWRGDEVSCPGNVFSKILEDIDKADVVVADLTGKNPNVFYETAFAHMRKAPQQVVLLAQNNADVPVDLQALRYLKYTDDEDSRTEFKKRLRSFLQQAVSGSAGEILEPIKGALERTRRIVADLNVLVQGGFPDRTVRIQAGLSSLAVADSEVQYAATGAPLEYFSMLLAERNALRKIVQDGGTIRMILSPPTERYFESKQHFDGLCRRYERMIAVLEGRTPDPDDKCLRSGRCRVVLSPFRGNNMLIVGERLLYEGIKANIGGGFELTSRVTHRPLVEAQVRAFDTLFDDAARYTRKMFGDGQAAPFADSDSERRSVIDGLGRAYGRYKARQAGVPEREVFVAPPHRRASGSRKGGRKGAPAAVHVRSGGV